MFVRRHCKTSHGRNVVVVLLRRTDAHRDQAGSAHADHRSKRRLGSGRVGDRGGQQRRARAVLQAKTVQRPGRLRRVSDSGQVDQDSGRRGRDAVREHGGFGGRRRNGNRVVGGPRVPAVQAVEQRRIGVGRRAPAVPRHTERGQDTDVDATPERTVAAPAGTSTAGPDQRPTETVRTRGCGRGHRTRFSPRPGTRCVVRDTGASCGRGGRCRPGHPDRRGRRYGRRPRTAGQHGRRHHDQVQQKHVPGPEDRGQRPRAVPGAHD